MTTAAERGKRPNVVGLDLSITATGIAYQFGDHVVTETWDMPAKLGDARLELIVAALADLCPARGAKDAADLVVIEGPVVRSSAAVSIGMVHGAVRVELMSRGIPYVLVPPATLKKYATGVGNCDKTAMALAAFKRGGVEFADDNQCDAWWLLMAGRDALGHPAFDLPAVQRAALDKVQWPAVCDLLPEDARA